ncbi:MAG: glycosyltransferase family 2 protein [Methylococcaceae bacterium]|nr:glycosyltransferase family 2 protein [Methylococcaceae bacterium]
MYDSPPSSTHLIIVPSYNTGALLEKTIREILAKWQPVWVIMDGSDDGSDMLLQLLQQQFSKALQIIKLPENQGKGAAIMAGILRAQAAGYSHVLIMDADNQHSADTIHTFMQKSRDNLPALLLGEPVFDASAPALRVQGRKISNGFANLETLSWAIHDSLFGMRVYPIHDLLAVMRQTRWARRFDFEPEVAVRLAWRGLPIINIPTPVRYIPKADGGVSHFQYGRDNTLLTWMHMRLLVGFILRLPKLLFRKYATH